MVSSVISVCSFHDQKHWAKYSLNALRASSRRRSRSDFSLSFMPRRIRVSNGVGKAGVAPSAKRLEVRQDSGALVAALHKSETERVCKRRRKARWTAKFQTRLNRFGSNAVI